MSNDNRPINQQTLNNLAALLGQFLENFGGDRQQQEKNLRQTATLKDLPEALRPTASQAPFISQIPDAQGNPQQLFKLHLMVAEPTTTGEEVDRIDVGVVFHHPLMADGQMLAVLTATADWRAVAFVGSGLHTADDDENKAQPNKIQEFFQNAKDGLGEDMAKLIQSFLLGVANAIPAENLPTPGRKAQAIINTELGLSEAHGDLALSDTMIARVPNMVTFLASLYKIDEQELHRLFEPTLRETIKSGNPLTASDFQESVLSHDALKEISLGVGRVNDNNEVSLVALEIPLWDDEGNKLDSLAIVFTPDNIQLQFVNADMTISQHPDTPSGFKGKEVAQLVSASKTLSGEQAAKNKAILIDALQILAKSATGRSSKKIQEALMLFTSV